MIAGIKANTPLFFGCDVGKSSNSAEGVMDTGLYDIKAAYGFGFNMTKAQRLQTGESSMTHAMVITAVHLDGKGRPVRYKVDNSWSEAAGEKGWFMMTADWFRENVFQVVVPRSIVDSKWTKVLDGGHAVVLPPWDPMVSASWPVSSGFGARVESWCCVTRSKRDKMTDGRERLLESG